MSRRQPAVKIAAFAYANDAALVSDTTDAAQRQLHCFQTVSAQEGLRLNASKTEVMHVGDIQHTPTVTTEGVTLKACEDFYYLGCNITDCRSAFRRRRQLVWTAARKLTRIWNGDVSEAAVYING